ncbi:hypothetical protein [Synechococcus sp. MIT S9507]|uniref:hypothetical protein n=1 Tax=Synechococcus sp. MIT S9507 TaxID=3082544 RepID=UPI0039B639AD
MAVRDQRIPLIAELDPINFMWPDAIRRANRKGPPPVGRLDQLKRSLDLFI